MAHRSASMTLYRKKKMPRITVDPRNLPLSPEMIGRVVEHRADDTVLIETSDIPAPLRPLDNPASFGAAHEISLFRESGEEARQRQSIEMAGLIPRYFAQMLNQPLQTDISGRLTTEQQTRILESWTPPGDYDVGGRLTAEQRTRILESTPSGDYHLWFVGEPDADDYDGEYDDDELDPEHIWNGTDDGGEPLPHDDCWCTFCAPVVSPCRECNTKVKGGPSLCPKCSKLPTKTIYELLDDEDDL